MIGLNRESNWITFVNVNQKDSLLLRDIPGMLGMLELNCLVDLKND